MTDERGGRYFREARFFLAGDKVAAQSHILEARSLMGYMRDMQALGGPPIQVQYATLKDGTQIKATMMNGQYQAEIVSPGRPLAKRKTKYPATVVGRKHITGPGGFSNDSAVPIKWQRSTGVVELPLPTGYAYGSAIDVDATGDVAYGYAFNPYTPAELSDGFWPWAIVVWTGATEYVVTETANGFDIADLNSRGVDFVDQDPTRRAKLDGTHRFVRYVDSVQMYLSPTRDEVVGLYPDASRTTTGIGFEAISFARDGLAVSGRHRATGSPVVGTYDAAVTTRGGILDAFGAYVELPMYWAHGYSAANGLVVGSVLREIPPHSEVYPIPAFWTAATGTVLIEPMDWPVLGSSPEDYRAIATLAVEEASELDVLTSDDTDELIVIGSMIGNHAPNRFDTERPVAWALEQVNGVWEVTRVAGLYNAFPGRLISTN